MKTFEQFWAERPGDILDPKSDHERTYMAGVKDAIRSAATLDGKIAGHLVDIGRLFPGFDLMKLGPHGTAAMIMGEIRKLRAEIDMLKAKLGEDSALLDWLEGHPCPVIGPDGEIGHAFAIAGTDDVSLRHMIKAAMKAEQEANATNKDLN